MCSESEINPRYRIFVLVLLWFTALSQPGFGQSSTDVVQLGIDDISPEEKIIYLSDVWLFQAGDEVNWAQTTYSDTSWQQISTYLGPSELPFLDWNGIGWFRLHIKVDSSLVNYPLAIVVQQHNGASQIFLDGEHITDIGRVSASANSYQPERNFNPIPIVFSDTTEHVLAVRYANHESQFYNQADSTMKCNS